MIGKVILTFCLTGLVLLSVYGGEQEKATAFPETRNVAILRKIGHELLLSGGDSTTRILPLKKLSETEYRLFFETEQRISPDSFVCVVNETARRYFIEENFTASIHNCANHALVYATLFSRKSEESVTACNGRILPRACYYLQFSFAAPRKNKNNVLLFGAGGIMLVLSIVGMSIIRKKRKPALSIPVPEPENANAIRLGQFQFYPDQQSLHLKGTNTPLTPRETRLLELLAASPNLVIDRDTLQKEIWEKEGVITTRSLDMFVSKLRKKLLPDPSLKISVVHGKGYKLEIASS